MCWAACGCCWAHSGGGGFVLDYSYHFIKNFDKDYSTIHIFVIKNVIGQLSRLTTRLTTTYHFNSGQQTSNIKNTLPSLPRKVIELVCCFSLNIYIYTYECYSCTNASFLVVDCLQLMAVCEYYIKAVCY